jgi:fructose-specific phosphotransferase system IIC component
MLRILCAVLVGSAFAGTALSIIGTFLLWPADGVIDFLVAQVVAIVVSVGYAVLIWRYFVQRKYASHGRG